MDNIELLFKDVNPKNHSQTTNYIENKIRIKDRSFSIKSIYKIIEHVKWISANFQNAIVRIIIDSDNIVDQVAILIFESVIYYIINELRLTIKYKFTLNKQKIGYVFFNNSILAKYNNTRINKKIYNLDYEKKIVITRNHYRKRSSVQDDNKQLSITMDEISCFFKSTLGEEEYSNDLSEVIIEVIGNAIEHSKSNCLTSINIFKDDKINKKIIDVAVIDYSEVSIGTGIEKYLHDENKASYSINNKIVIDAYENHKKFFSKEYNMSDFSLISAFQKGVTSRKKSTQTGGTGLTTLIKALIEKSVNNYCYVCSGDTILYFKKEFLKLTNDEQIGFNENNDYLHYIPNENTISRNDYNINVNAYNLQFIF